MLFSKAQRHTTPTTDKCESLTISANVPSRILDALENQPQVKHASRFRTGSFVFDQFRCNCSPFPNQLSTPVIHEGPGNRLTKAVSVGRKCPLPSCGPRRHHPQHRQPISKPSCGSCHSSASDLRAPLPTASSARQTRFTSGSQTNEDEDTKDRQFRPNSPRLTPSGCRQLRRQQPHKILYRLGVPFGCTVLCKTFTFHKGWGLCREG